MKTIHNIFNFTNSKKTIFTIGTFDGVHSGHQKILNKLVLEAKKSNKKSAILTFFPHPRMVLQKNLPLKLINTIEERTKLIEKNGIDYLIIHPFDKAFSRMTALEFIRDIMVNWLNISKLIIGYDHYFGKNREGNIQQLIEYSHLYNFKVDEIPAKIIDKVSVSSTKIRRALSEGNIKVANKYLGYNFMLNGNVSRGNKLGGTIGFPTANIHIEENYKLIPKTGVYIVKSKIDKTTVYGMMNIGNRPTISGMGQTIEVHFLDFNKNIYNQNLNIELMYFLRNEVKFDSLEDLVSQLKKDEQFVRNYIKPSDNS